MTHERHELGNGRVDGTLGCGSSLGRRSLLGGAAAGLALAASGLVLPEWLIEGADAADRPLRRIADRNDGQSAQRRRRLERRREQNRRQRDRNANDDRPRGLFDPFNIFVGVRFTNAQTALQTARLSFQTYNDPGFGQPKSWDTRGTATLHLPPDEEELNNWTTYKFDVPKVRVVVDIPDGRWVEIENPSLGFPSVTVYNQDRSRETSSRYAEGEEGVYRGGDFNDEILKIRRNKDTPGYKNFAIDILALGYYCSTC